MATKVEHNVTAREALTAIIAERPLTLPHFAIEHAPIFHLHTDEIFRPSSLSDFLYHTHPKINFIDVPVESPPLTICNLNQLHNIGDQGKEVYLTSLDHVSLSPPPPEWLKGVSMVDCKDHRTGANIVVHKGNGIVDIFYFIFFAFNYGGIVLGKNLGNHVGDWEHVMIRFIDEKPKFVWFSQHSNGEAYDFKALEKFGSGKRPVVYIAKGSHAMYPRTGAIDHTIPNYNSKLPFLLVDYCNKGQRYDPLEASYNYTYKPEAEDMIRRASRTSNPADIIGEFEEITQNPTCPSWLKFRGHWGDKEYPRTDPRQTALLSFQRYVDGPTGPAFKDLARKKVWPANSHAWGQRIRTSLDESTSLKDWFQSWRWTCVGLRKVGWRVKGKPKRVGVDGQAVEQAEK